MSESDKTFENSSSGLSYESRDDETDFDNVKKIDLVSNPLFDDCIDTIHSESKVCSYNRESQGEKKEDYYRNQMIDLPKLLRQLSHARVILERLSISPGTTKLQTSDDQAPDLVGRVYQDIDANAPQDKHVPPSEYIDDSIKSRADSLVIINTRDTVDETRKSSDKLTTTRKLQKLADLIKRYCPECKVVIVGAKVYSKQSCTKCGTSLDFQCARCDKQYSVYHSLVHHLHTICQLENLDLKCPKCDYRTQTKIMMDQHKRYCLSEIIYRCSYCKLMSKYRTNLVKHIRKKHEDTNQAVCSKCATKPNKCRQCTFTTFSVCETCHTCFVSSNELLEHHKSCKQ